jgi:hypothetical protein
MSEREIERIYQEEPNEETVREAEQAYLQELRREAVDDAIAAASKDGEDKQLICSLLCWTLKATRDQADLKQLIYHKDEEHDTELVEVVYSEGGTNVNVAMDSGIAMIRDILRTIS